MEMMTKGRSLGSARPQHAVLGVDSWAAAVESVGCTLVCWVLLLKVSSFVSSPIIVRDQILATSKSLDYLPHQNQMSALSFRCVSMLCLWSFRVGWGGCGVQSLGFHGWVVHGRFE